MLYTNILESLTNLTNRNIKQKELAEVLGLTPQNLNNKIKRKQELTKEDIQKIEQVYNIKYSEKSSEDCFDLPLLSELTASLGNGIEVFNEKPTSYFPLPKSLLKKIGANPQTSSIINTCGESMYPTIIGGSDKLLIDLSKKEIYDGKIYLIRFDNTIFAKRLQKLPNNQLKIISDNKEYESYTIDLNDSSINFDIIGRVLWISRKL